MMEEEIYEDDTLEEMEAEEEGYEEPIVDDRS